MGEFLFTTNKTTLSANFKILTMDLNLFEVFKSFKVALTWWLERKAMAMCIKRMLDLSFRKPFKMQRILLFQRTNLGW